MCGKLSKRQAQLIYGIKGNATTLYWINQSRGLHGYEKRRTPIGNFAEMKKNIHDKKLEEENKDLKELLRVAELRADLWQHVKRKREIWKRGSGRNLHQSLQHEFKTHDLKIGRDKFFDLLRNNHLLIKSKRFRTKKTCSYHHFNRYKNLIETAVPLRSNEIWVADITYLWLKPQDKFCYLSVITDLYSRKVVGHCVHESLSVKGCIDALKQALKSRMDKTQPLIHHSDRGVQYCCHAYVKMLQKQQIQISMTQTGDPLENAVAERIHKTIKEEFTDERQINFCNIEKAKTDIKKFIEFYNRQRPHRSVQWLTPNAAHQCTGALKRVWKSYRGKVPAWGDLAEA